MPAGLVHLPVHCPAAAKIFLLFAILLAIEAESINSGLKRQQQRFDQRFCLCIWPLPCPRTDSLHSMLFNMPNLHGSDLCRVRVCICSRRDFYKSFQLWSKYHLNSSFTEPIFLYLQLTLQHVMQVHRASKRPKSMISPHSFRWSVIWSQTVELKN